MAINWTPLFTRTIKDPKWPGNRGACACQPTSATSRSLTKPIPGFPPPRRFPLRKSLRLEKYYHSLAGSFQGPRYELELRSDFTMSSHRQSRRCDGLVPPGQGREASCAENGRHRPRVECVGGGGGCEAGGSGRRSEDYPCAPGGEGERGIEPRAVTRLHGRPAALVWKGEGGGGGAYPSQQRQGRCAGPGNPHPRALPGRWGRQQTR